MLIKNNRYKILKLFFDSPTGKFYIRKISRILKISAPTVAKIIEEFAKRELVVKRKTRVVDEVGANLDNKNFISAKKVDNLTSIYESRLLEELEEEYAGGTIILFGSYAKGEDIERSDIDIAVITNKHKKLNLEVYEKELKRKINIHEVELKKVSKEFKNSLVNGVVLTGYFKLL